MLSVSYVFACVPYDLLSAHCPDRDSVLSEEKSSSSRRKRVTEITSSFFIIGGAGRANQSQGSAPSVPDALALV